jgi:hypothetical protein
MAARGQNLEVVADPFVFSPGAWYNPYVKAASILRMGLYWQFIFSGSIGAVIARYTDRV